MFRISKSAARRMGIITGAAERVVSSQPGRGRAIGRGIAGASPVSGLSEPQATVEIKILGRPMAKEASRVRNGAFYKPRRTGGFERQVSAEAALAMRGFKPFSGPVAVAIVQYRAMPKQMTKAQRSAAAAGALLPDTKPDVDNMQKSLFDGLKRVVFEDDAQVCQQSFEKRFGAADCVVIRVWPLPGLGIRRKAA